MKSWCFFSFLNSNVFLTSSLMQQHWTGAVILNPANERRGEISSPSVELITPAKWLSSENATFGSRKAFKSREYSWPRIAFCSLLLQDFSAFSSLLKPSQMSLEIYIVTVSREPPSLILWDAELLRLRTRWSKCLMSYR